MRRLVIPILALVTLPTFAQQQPPTPSPKRPGRPIFSPEPPAQDDKSDSRSTPARAARPVEAPAPPQSADPVDALFARLSRWPDRTARDAAIALSGLGAEVEARLIQNLNHNDWRVQAGSAAALAEMGSKSAVKALGVAIKDPTNGAALSELMRSIVRIDPVDGPKEVIPFLTHPAGRVREAAMKAMPNPLDAHYVDDAAEMFKNRNPVARATAIALFSRIPEAANREELFLALSDPEVTVANPAMRYLATFGDESSLKRLVVAAREGTLRQAAYAFLGLTIAEDARGVVLVAEADPARDRAYAMLQGEEPFYRAAAAIFLSNLAFRSDDATIRTIADRYLVPILLDAVAGANFYNDYVAIEELGYRKLELLSGEVYGQNSLKWRAWWQRSAESFKARHQLRAISAGELVRCTVTIRVEEPGGRIRSAVFVGDTALSPPGTAGQAFVLGPKDRDVLKAAFESSRFFLARGDPETAVRLRSMTEISVQCADDRFVRRHNGDPPPELVPLVNTMFDIARSLSWQHFAPREPAARAQYIREQTAFFATADQESQRLRLLDLALAGYPSFGRDGRAAAVELLSVSSPEFRARNTARLLDMLRSEPSLNDEAAGLIGVLSTVDAVPVREQVLAYLGRAPAAKANDVLRDFLARQPKTNVMAALRSEAAVNRVAAAEALGRFKGDRDVVSLLIEAIGDFDPRVRDAAVRTLATFEDERIPAMLEAAVLGQDKTLRVRAIEALGPVEKSAAVPRLMEIFRGGDVHERFAVIRSLGTISEKRATIALGSIVRECPDVQMCGEALNVLAKSTDPSAPAEVAEIFQKSRVPDIRLQAVDALATLRKEAAVPDLVPSLGSEDADLRRVVMLTLARLGAREALVPLLETLNKPEGDPAAEAAFNRLTFFVSEQKAPAHRTLEYRKFVEDAGHLQRSEWFALALRGLKLDPAVIEGFELEAPMDARHYDVLLKVLAAGNWSMRVEADSRLLAETALTLSPLTRVSGPDDVQERSGVYRRWVELNAGSLSGVQKRPPRSPASRPAEPESRAESR